MDILLAGFHLENCPRGEVGVYLSVCVYVCVCVCVEGFIQDFEFFLGKSIQSDSVLSKGGGGGGGGRNCGISYYFVCIVFLY